MDLVDGERKNAFIRLVAGPIYTDDSEIIGTNSVGCLNAKGVRDESSHGSISFPPSLSPPLALLIDQGPVVRWVYYVLQ